MRFHPVHNAPIRRLCGWLLMLAVLTRGLVPVGFMPGSAAHGSHFLNVSLCSGYGPERHMMQIAVPDAPQSHGQEDPAWRGKMVCDYAINSIFALAGAAPPLLTGILLGYSIIIFFTSYRLNRARRFTNASSRSPPVVCA